MSQKALNFAGHSLTATGTNRTGLTVGAVLQTYNSILGQLSIGDTFTYLLHAANTNGTAYGWETGQATYTAANTVTLVPSDSTNGGAALNLPNGPHQLLCSGNAATQGVIGPLDLVNTTPIVINNPNPGSPMVAWATPVGENVLVEASTDNGATWTAWKYGNSALPNSQETSGSVTNIRATASIGGLGSTFGVR